jgi:hypothetical protein
MTRLSHNRTISDANKNCLKAWEAILISKATFRDFIKEKANTRSGARGLISLAPF